MKKVKREWHTLQANEGCYLTQVELKENEPRRFLKEISGFYVQEENWKEITEEEKEAIIKELEEKQKNEEEQINIEKKEFQNQI